MFFLAMVDAARVGVLFVVAWLRTPATVAQLE